MSTTTKPPRVQMVCSHCGSDDVNVDASARWNARRQCWELSATYGNFPSCEDCGGDTHVEEVNLKSWQAKQRRIARKAEKAA